MAISLASVRKSAPRTAKRILAYGPHGLGKTALGASAPNPIFMQFEDGLGNIEADTFGLLNTFGQAMECIEQLYTESHNFQTLVVDTLDWFEPPVWEETCKRNNWDDIEAPGYGKGYAATPKVWRDFLSGTNALCQDRGMNVILLAHSDVKKFRNPEVGEYDRNQPKLHDKGSYLVQENVDCIFYMNYLVSLTKEPGAKKDEKPKRAVGGGQRALYTEERPAYLAKNRFDMPQQILLPDDPTKMWAEVAQYF